MTAEAVARLVALAQSLSLEPEDFDDAVHDSAGEETLGDLNDAETDESQEEVIAGSERSASEINNGGLAEQIEYLLEGYNGDVEAMENRIREIASTKT